MHTLFIGPIHLITKSQENIINSKNRIFTKKDNMSLANEEKESEKAKQEI